jgi:PAS domain S-box-containing protein
MNDRIRAGELVLAQLIDSLMRTALEGAGAERGLLITVLGGVQRLEAEAVTSRDATVVRLLQTSVSGDVLPDSLLNHVVHRQERVILDDAVATGAFSADPYIRRKHVRSALCLPLVSQNTLIAVLYLENNQAPYVFTPGRIEVLTLIASQVATSLETAHLYSELRRAHAELELERSERRRVEHALRQNQMYLAEAAEKARSDERELRVTIDTLPAFVLCAQPGGEVDFVSRSIMDYTGLPGDRWLGSGWRKSVHEEDVERITIQWREALSTGVTFEVEMRILGARGHYRWFQCRGHAFRNEAKEILRWYCTMHDIEDRKRAEEKLRQSEAYLAEAQALTKTGSWAHNLQSGAFVVSPEMMRIFGLDSGSASPATP